MRSLKILLPLLSIFFYLQASGQDEPIVLTNPSFEGAPRGGTINGSMPEGWADCGFAGESVPDIHPEENGGSFQVDKPAFEGKTYIGLVVRENDTWERVTQRLTQPLQAGKCYEFSISLCRSLIYMSAGRLDGEMKNYTTPAKLRIWGGAGRCDRAELLAESSLIINSRWLEYNFRFEPQQEHRYIVFEAFYKTPTPFPYNGNILMDNASAIIPVPCIIETPEVADVEVPDEPETPPAEVNKPEPPPTPETPVAKTKPAEPKILADLDRNKLKVGETIRIDQLYFQADSSAITDRSYPVLEEVFTFLSGNPDVVVEIGGHTNGIPPHEYCDRLSTARAKAVADFLVGKGIPKMRLKYKGYGKRDPVETNKTAYGRKRNQRVEIKILSFDG